VFRRAATPVALRHFRRRKSEPQGAMEEVR
jgi:hypothetical protein